MIKMIKFKGNALLTALLLGGASVLTNCSSAATNNAAITKANADNTAVVNSKSVNTNTQIAKTDAPPNGKIGIAECDEYIKKFEACVNTKVPESQRPNFMSSFNNMRQVWKVAADNPQIKPTVAGSCKQALEASKKSMSSFACTW